MGIDLVEQVPEYSGRQAQDGDWWCKCVLSSMPAPIVPVLVTTSSSYSSEIGLLLTKPAFSFHMSCMHSDIPALPCLAPLCSGLPVFLHSDVGKY